MQAGTFNWPDQVAFTWTGKGRQNYLRLVEARGHQDFDSGGTRSADTVLNRTNATQARPTVETRHLNIKADEVERLLPHQRGGNRANDGFSILGVCRAVRLELGLEDE